LFSSGAGNVMGLQSALMVRGFEVPAGSPAERIMRAAEKCGHAEELPDDPRWREELIQARARAKGAKQFGAATRQTR